MSKDQGNNQGPVFDDGARLNAPTQQQESHEDGTGIVPPPFTDRSTDYASNPKGNREEEERPAASSSFGAPPMGDPAEPSSHPDNRTAAEETTEAAVPKEGPLSGAQGGGLRRQQSGFDGTQTDRGFGGQSNNGAAAPAGASDYRQTPTQPGTAGTTAGVGQQPGSPYVETAEVPPSGKGPMNLILENLNKWAGKAEGLAGNVWSHLRAGPSVRETAWGWMTYGTRLLTEGGFEGVYKQTFGVTNNEQLRKTYACYLSTSTGPVAGTLYISNLKFAFCSDRPLSYAPAPGEQAWSYYKVVIPLEKVKEVVPSVNENKTNEKYIQVLTNDGHDFWFMGFVNYDKGVMNMQDALQNIGVVDPHGGLRSPFGGNRNRDVPAQNTVQQPASATTQNYVTSGQGNTVPSSQAAAGNIGQQPAGATTQDYVTSGQGNPVPRS
jgi:hypothetical protein